MKITFELSIKDYMIFYKKNLRENVLLFKPYIFLIAVLVTVILIVFNKDYVFIINSHDLSNTYLGLLINSVITFGFLIGLIFIIRSSIWHRILKQINENPFLIGHHEFELINNKLILKTQTTTTEFMKESFNRIDNTSDYIYLYRGKQSALIIPKTSKEFDEQFNKWLKS